MRHAVQTSVAVAASLVALAFALFTFERWLARRRRYDLAWTVALGLFALAAAALAAGAQAGWSGGTFRVFYLFGAIVNVPVLALGTVYLLADRRAGDGAALGVALFCAFAAGVVVIAPFRAPLPVNQLAQGSKVFGPLPRVLAALGSAGGAIVIFGGAAWSARQAVVKGAPRRLMWSNSVIALGTLILGASGTLNSIFGAMTAFAVTLLIGIVVIFTGFLLAAAGTRATPPAQVIPPAEPWRPPPRRAISSWPDTALAGSAGAASRPGRAGSPARR
jgi:hypothetical protein